MNIYIYISSQIKEILNEGRPAVIRKSKKICLAILWSPLVIALTPIVLLIRLIKPIICIRFGFFWAERIGHYAFDVEYFLTEKELDSDTHKKIDLFFYKGKPCNTFFDQLVRENLIITFICKPLYLTNNIIPGGKAHTLLPAIRRVDSRDRDLLFSKVNNQLTIDENIDGLNYLEQIGLKEKDKFVCLIARDSAYLKKHLPKNDYSYHNYRDTNILDYKESVLSLIKRGYWVFRMGKNVNDPLNIENQMAIDYANSTDRSDFLDIWLMANCTFCISNGTGLDEVARIFRKPAVKVDYIPINVIDSFDYCITVPKHLIWKKTSDPLTLSEHLVHSYAHSEKYNAAGILIKDLSPLEKKQAILELENRISGSWISNDHDEMLQSQFWKILRSDKNFDRNHKKFHPNARVGANYLRSNPDWLK